MDDLISRKAAIAELDHAAWGKEYDKALAKAMLESLPTAQPEIVRCKDCKHRIVNEHLGEKGYLNLKAMCELDTDDPFELGRNAEDDEWFCADAERRTDETN